MSVLDGSSITLGEMVDDPRCWKSSKAVDNEPTVEKIVRIFQILQSSSELAQPRVSWRVEVFRAGSLENLPHRH